MVKKLLGTVCSAILLANFAAAETSTGAFVEVNAGGAYTKIKEYARHSSQKASDQIELFDAKKNFGFVIGASVGYGYEMLCGFYVGAKVYGAYDATKIKDDSKSAPTTKQIKVKDGTVVSASMIHQINEGKPQFSYGAALQLGGKLIPNCLVFASFGVEGTYTKIKQAILAGEFFAVQNDFGNGVEVKDGDSTCTALSNGSEALKVNLISLVPGIGFKYFFTPAVYVGLNVDFPIGISKKVEDKYYNTQMKANVKKPDPANAAAVVESEVSAPSLSETGNSLYIKRDFNVRYGIGIGYKF
jgi:hypothetical protein